MFPAFPFHSHHMLHPYHPISPDVPSDFRAFYPYTPNEVKHRKRTTSTQLRTLESVFKRDTKPNAAVRNQLAEQLKMTPRGVQVRSRPLISLLRSATPVVHWQVWFQNRCALYSEGWLVLILIPRIIHVDAPKRRARPTKQRQAQSKSRVHLQVPQRHRVLLQSLRGWAIQLPWIIKRLRGNSLKR